MAAKEEIPRRKRPRLTERVTLSVDPGMRAELTELKDKKNVDVSEWLRGLIRRELPLLKKRA